MPRTRAHATLFAMLMAIGLVGCAPMDDSGSGGNGFINRIYRGPPPLGTCNGLTGVCDTALTPIPLTGCAQSDYTMPVSLGNQTFALIMDSGSSTLAIADSSCSSCGVSPSYTPSSSATNTGQTASANYGGGEGWVGTVYRDTVAVTSSVPALTMAIAAITSETVQQSGAVPFFAPSSCMGTQQSNSSQGIIGMAGIGAGNPNTNAYMVELATTVTPTVFSVEMCDLNGYAWLGGYNPNFIAAAPRFTPLVSDSSYYDVNLADVQVNGVSVGVNTSNTGITIVDTGTTGLLLTSSAFNAVVAPIQSNNTFANNFGSNFLANPNPVCSAPISQMTATQLNASLPTLTLVFPAVGGGTFELTLPATESYLTPVVFNGQVMYCPAVSEQSAATGAPAIVIGNAFMHSSVTIFDRENMQIGFAQEANCVQIGD